MPWVAPIPGDPRPGWLLVVLKSLEIPFTACHITKTPKIPAEHSDRDITSQPTSLRVFWWCEKSHSPMSRVRPPRQYECVCASSFSVQTSHRRPGKVKGRGHIHFFLGGGALLEHQNPFLGFVSNCLPPLNVNSVLLLWCKTGSTCLLYNQVQTERKLLILSWHLTLQQYNPTCII